MRKSSAKQQKQKDKNMSVFALIIILLALALGYWLINVKFGATVGAPFKLLINIVLVVTAIVLVLYAFGIWDEVRNVKVPKI